MDRLPVLVAGGGIGGLSVALTLHQIGVPCIVLEAVADRQVAHVATPQGANMLASNEKKMNRRKATAHSMRAR